MMTFNQSTNKGFVCSYVTCVGGLMIHRSLPVHCNVDSLLLADVFCRFEPVTNRAFNSWLHWSVVNSHVAYIMSHLLHIHAYSPYKNKASNFLPFKPSSSCVYFAFVCQLVYSEVIFKYAL